MTPTIIRIKKSSSKYRFDTLKHGDVIEVEHPTSAKEVFRRWRKRHARTAQLIQSQISPKLLIFIDEQLV